MFVEPVAHGRCSKAAITFLPSLLPRSKTF
jgi:hypothetical protein